MSILMPITERGMGLDGEMNSGKKKKINFWQSEVSEQYEIIPEKRLTTDRPAYGFAYGLYDLTGQIVLDVGSHNGNSSKNIFGSRKPRYVRGIDNNREMSRSAAINHSIPGYLEYAYVGNEEPIPLAFGNTEYDIAFATFVHPTIGTTEELYDLFGRVWKVLQPGGKFILLGLHHMSFDPRWSFLNYRHGLSKTNEIWYRDGEMFPVELVDNFGSTITSFHDFWWTRPTLQNIFADCGYTDFTTYPLQFGMLDIEKSILLKNEYDIVAAESPEILNYDEFQNAPLHQVIVVTK
jgi:SAM-dependent methyltransferase